jgi:succinate dehydrogenase/fumarate reductase flavoprotein subunit
MIWDIPPTPLTESDIKETIDVDIVIVGAGLAGCFAACRGSELGAKVAVVEKMAFPSSRGGHYGAYQTAAMTRMNLINDPLDQIVCEWMRLAGNRAKQKIIYKYLENSGRIFDWMETYSKEFPEGGLVLSPIVTRYVGPYYREHIGTHTILGPQQGSGPLRPDRGYPGNEHKLTPPVYWAWKQAEINGTRFFFNTPAEQLIKENGRVTSVIARGPQGFMRLNASQGILLASGDFAGDPEMRQAFADPVSLRCKKFTYTPVGANTGDGQKMAMSVGAHMFLGKHQSPAMMHLIAFSRPCFGFLHINSSGRRFMNEDTWIQAKSISILQQPGDNNYAYSIFDADYEDQVEASLPYGGGQFWDSMNHLPDEPYNWGSIDDPFSTRGLLESGLLNGTVFRADTLAELARKIEVEPAILESEVMNYNKWYDQGVDEDYHKRKELLTPIRTPPFTAVKFGPANLVYPNGVEVNEDMQVLDDQLEPISGLYAAGNASGGRYAVDYPVIINGNSHGSALSFGFLVGEQLAQSLQDGFAELRASHRVAC